MYLQQPTTTLFPYTTLFRSGKLSHNITQIDTTTFRIIGDNASLDNLVFAENQIGTLFLQFNFLTQEVTEKEFYTYHRSEEHTSELQSRENLVCRLLLEKKNQ